MPDESSDQPKLTEKQFEYSVWAQGTYRGLLWVTLLTPLLGRDVFVAHVFLMLFLGFGLRPLLEKTGLYRLVSHYLLVIRDKSSEKFMAKRVEEIERKQRDEKFRRRRLKHPDLPKNW